MFIQNIKKESKDDLCFLNIFQASFLNEAFCASKTKQIQNVFHCINIYLKIIR